MEFIALKILFKYLEEHSYRGYDTLSSLNIDGKNIIFESLESDKNRFEAHLQVINQLFSHLKQYPIYGQGVFTCRPGKLISRGCFYVCLNHTIAPQFSPLADSHALFKSILGHTRSLTLLPVKFNEFSFIYTQQLRFI